MDLLKFALGTFAYLVIPPVLAFMAGRSSAIRRILIATMLFMTALPVSLITLTAFNQDGYRGHVRGFEFCTVDIVALGLIGAALIRRPSRLRLCLLPGGLYFLMCLCSLPGLSNALSPLLGAMAVFKYGKAILLLMAAIVAIEDEQDIRVLWWAMTIGLLSELLAGLSSRYLHGTWRVSAWFEHSNSMAMWSYMLSVPLLGVVLVDQGRKAFAILSLVAVAGGGALVILSLARGSLAAYVVGVGVVLLVTVVRQPNPRTAMVAATLLLGAVIMGAIAADSILNRIHRSQDQEGVENYRAVLNRQSALMLSDHPLGIGWNNYGIANSRPLGGRYSAVMEDWEASLGHRIIDENFHANPLTESYYWLQLAENGYLGFCSHVLFFLATLWWCWRAYRRHRSDAKGGFALAFTFTLLLLYGHSTFERVLVQTKNLDAWLILIGACVAIMHMPVEGGVKRPSLSSADRNLPE